MAHAFCLNANIHEFVFARMIEDHNIRVLNKGGTNFISARRGRELHDVFMKNIAEEEKLLDVSYFNFNDPNKNPMLLSDVQRILANTFAMSGEKDPDDPWRLAVCTDQNGNAVKGPDGNPIHTAAPEMRNIFRAYYDDWENVTGIPIRGGQAEERKLHGVAFTDANMIPCSPFDPEYSMRQTVLEHGTEILYLPADRILDQAEGPVRINGQWQPGRVLEAKFDSAREMAAAKLDFKRRTFREHDSSGNLKNAAANTYTSSFHFDRLAGPAATETDLLGLSPLISLVPDKELRRAQLHMRGTPDELLPTPETMKVSTAILEHLQNRGISYEIQPGAESHQLYASIGSRTAVCVVDASHAGAFQAAAFYDGVSARFAVNRISGIGEHWILANRLDIKDRLTMMDKALGVLDGERFGSRYLRLAGPRSNLPRLSGPIGTPSVYENKIRDNGPDRRTGVRSGGYYYISRSGKLTFTTEGGVVAVPLKDVPEDVLKATETKRSWQRYNIVTARMSKLRPGNDTEFTADSAAAFLRGAVHSARLMFAEKIGVEFLIAEHGAHPEDEDYIPMLSGDPTIAPVQLVYWNVLRGRQTLRQFEDIVADAVNEAMNAGSESEDQNDSNDIEDFENAAGIEVKQLGRTYDDRDPARNVRDHLNDSINAMFGHFDADPVTNKRFSPSLVARYMGGVTGVYQNTLNIIAAMRALRFTKDELLGDDYDANTICDQLIYFDEAHAVPLSRIAGDEKTRENMAYIHGTILKSLEQNGCDVVDPEGDIRIDPMGIIQYKAKMRFGEEYAEIRDEEKAKAYYASHYSDPGEAAARLKDSGGFIPDYSVGYKDLVGEIGQIFVPDKDGLIETVYNKSEGRVFTPSYEVYIVPGTAETRGGPLEERYRFRGMREVLGEMIVRQLQHDILYAGPVIGEDGQADSERLSAGRPTSVNNAYSRMSKTSYKLFAKQKSEQSEGGGVITESKKATLHRQMTELCGMPEDVYKAILRNNENECSFDRGVIDDSSVNAEYRAGQLAKRGQRVSVHELLEVNDNVRNAYELTGHANMAITAENSGYGGGTLFDHRFTGSGKNQGKIRTLVTGASVSGGGKGVMPEEKGPDAYGYLSGLDANKFLKYTAADRAQMVLSNLKSCYTIADDGAEKGQRRPGVAQLTLQGWTFDDGAVISRRFAGMYKVPGGEDGGMRPLRPGDKICDMSGNKSIIALVVPDEPSDPAERAAELEKARAGGYEKAAALFWANKELDIVQSPYSAVSRFNAAGVRFAMEHPADLTLPDGKAVKGGIGFMPFIITRHTADDHTMMYDEDAAKQGRGRKVSAQQSWMLDAKGAVNLLHEIFSQNSGATVNMREALNAIGYDITETGRFMKGVRAHQNEERYLFKMPSENMRDTMNEADILDSFSKDVGSHGGYLVLPFPIRMLSGAETTKCGLDSAQNNSNTGDFYLLPIMSSHLRSGRMFEDGRLVVHDYTFEYQNIYKLGVDCLNARDAYNAAPEGSRARGEALEKMSRARESAQKCYDRLAADLTARRFENKHNIARDELMARRMPNSATAVWTPSPNLALHQIAMPGELAKILSVKDGDRVMVTRDPLLRTYGMRYMEVVINDDLKGVAVNPLIAISFDGDFDGDSVGLWTPRTDAAKEEAYRLFSFEQNMLDFSKVRDNGDYALMINDSMDVISSEFYDPALYNRRMELERAFNEAYKIAGYEIRRRENERLMDKLSQWARDVLLSSCATAAVSYESPREHIRSLQEIVKTGAKGSAGKLAAYMQYAGFTAGFTDDGDIDIASVEDTRQVLVTDEDIRNTQLATAIKAHGTGFAGAISQRLAVALRDHGLIEELGGADGQKAQPQNALEPALRLTYLATQGILQAKHDPVQARVLYKNVVSVLPNLWYGYKMSVDGTGDYKVDYRYGEPVKASPEQWVKQFMDIHTDPENGLGLTDINIEDVRHVAYALTGSDGRMTDIGAPKKIEQMSSALDLLAYRHWEALELLESFAEEGRHLFGDSDKAFTRCFAPDTILRNITAVERGEPDSIRPVCSSDCVMGGGSYRPGRAVIRTEVAPEEGKRVITSKEAIRANSEMRRQAGDIDPRRVNQAQYARLDASRVQPVLDPASHTIAYYGVELSVTDRSTGKVDTGYIKVPASAVKDAPANAKGTLEKNVYLGLYYDSVHVLRVDRDGKTSSVDVAANVAAANANAKRGSSGLKRLDACVSDIADDYARRRYAPTAMPVSIEVPALWVSPVPGRDDGAAVRLELKDAATGEKLRGVISVPADAVDGGDMKTVFLGHPDTSYAFSGYSAATGEPVRRTLSAGEVDAMMRSVERGTKVDRSELMSRGGQFDETSVILKSVPAGSMERVMIGGELKGYGVAAGNSSAQIVVPAGSVSTINGRTFDVALGAPDETLTVVSFGFDEAAKTEYVLDSVTMTAKDVKALFS